MQLTKLVTLLAVAGAMIPAVAMAKKKKEAPTELRIGIMKKISDEDCLQKAKKGDVLKMHYTGKLFDDDTVFDSSITRGVPFEFTLGMGQVIKGWDQGIVGMCIGEKRKLVFPAEYGYGSLGSPPTIPANAALKFDVELLEINGVRGGVVSEEIIDKAIEHIESIMDEKEGKEEENEAKSDTKTQTTKESKKEKKEKKEKKAKKSEKAKKKKAKKESKETADDSGEKADDEEIDFEKMREANLKRAWEEVEEVLTKLNKQEEEEEQKEQEKQGKQEEQKKQGEQEHDEL